MLYSQKPKSHSEAQTK